MSRTSVFWRAVTVLAVWTAVWPALAHGQQDEPLRPNETSPATGHAQIIAHGVSAMPGQQIGWQVAVTRALLPNRARPEAQHPGFVLADRRRTGHDRRRRYRSLTVSLPERPPGFHLDEPRAVVSLERDPVDYVAIALLPAAELPASTQDRRMTGETPFAAPVGAAFDLDLIRDVLTRDEETTIAAGSAPSLLLVTDGTVFLTTADGTVSELDAGSVTQSAGDLVVSGGSRGPAAFVVARIGSEVPAQLPLRQEQPSNVPMATPVSAPGETSHGPASGPSFVLLPMPGPISLSTAPPRPRTLPSASSRMARRSTRPWLTRRARSPSGTSHRATTPCWPECLAISPRRALPVATLPARRSGKRASSTMPGFHWPRQTSTATGSSCRMTLAARRPAHRSPSSSVPALQA